MSTDLPIANNNDNTPETPSTANGDNNATLDPTTPTDFTLTSRQQRVLNYLARRRMRSARITKRQTYADLLETQHNNDKPAPDPLTPAPTTPESSAYLEQNETSAEPLWSPWNAGLTRDILTSHAATQPLKETPIPISAAFLPARTYRPRSAKKAWRRKKILRHLARKHIRAARASEYRSLRKLWTMMGTIFLVLLLVFLSVGTAGSFAA